MCLIVHVCVSVSTIQAGNGSRRGSKTHSAARAAVPVAVLCLRDHTNVGHWSFRGWSHIEIPNPLCSSTRTPPEYTLEEKLHKHKRLKLLSTGKLPKNIIYMVYMIYLLIRINAIYSYKVWWLIRNPLSGNGHSSRITKILSRIFRELHVYLPRNPCWATTPLIKIHSSLTGQITDTSNFFIAL